jgi:hypothetical protein
LGSEETESLRLWCPVCLNFLSGYVYHLAMNSFHLLAEIASESSTPARWDFVSLLLRVVRIGESLREAFYPLSGESSGGPSH